MRHAHISETKSGPLWAALGAPLVGIPLLVALLALAAPPVSAPEDEPDAAPVALDVRGVDGAIESGPECPTTLRKS